MENGAGEDPEKRAIRIIGEMANMNEGEMNDSYFMVIEKDSLEKIDDIRGCCGCFFRVILTIKTQIVRIAHTVIMHSLFEAISLTVIVANSVVLAMEDPNAN